MKGGLWAFADLRYQGGDIGNNNPIDITSRKLVDGTTDWAEPILITHRNNSSKGYDFAFGDAATVADRESGKILLMTCGGRNGINATVVPAPYVVRHVYDPETDKWTTSDVSGYFYGTNNSYPSHLFVSSGRMIQSTIYKKDKYYRIYAGICTYSGHVSRVAYSDDLGETWNYLGGPTANPIPNGDECKVEELPDGSILLNAKRYGGGNYGRYTNIFTFTDIAKGEGAWGSVATSGTSDKPGETFTAYCNAEIMLVPAMRKSDSKQTYLLLLAGPASTGRNNPSIYWKELPSTAAEYRNPANYVSDWTRYSWSSTSEYCGYITMALDEDGNIALLDENGGIRYRNFSLSTITDGAFAYSPSASGTYHTTSEPALGSIVMPTLSVNGGTYTKEQQVEITATDGATIYYTLDGSEPQVSTTTTTSTKTYKDPITISKGVTTIKALAADNKGNVSRTVSASYYVTSTENTTAPSAGKQGTTITLDKTNATKLNTSNGQDSTIWAYLRHNSTHIQLIASVAPNLRPGNFQFFRWPSNNMSWSTPDSLLLMKNGIWGSEGGVQRYSYYCILAPKGYRFLSYEFVLDKSSENGASLQEYKYKAGSETEIELINSIGTASNSQDVKFGRTLGDGTNVLYFRHDALENSDQKNTRGKDQTPIVVKSLKLTYVVDEAFDALVPNENGTKIHSGFTDLGTFSQPKGYNWGFSNNSATDFMNINVKKADGTTPDTYKDGSNYYFLAKSDGDYYVEAPKKFRVIGATVNLKRAASSSYSLYTPSESTQDVKVVLQCQWDSKTYDKYLKVDESGNTSSVTTPAEATVFTVDYHAGSGENHYSLKLPNGKYLAMNSSQAIVTLDNVDQALWSYNSGWKFQYNGKEYKFIGTGPTETSWRAIAMKERSAIADRLPFASDFIATVYNRENTGAATDGTKSLTEANATQAITVSDMNNDAVRIHLSGIQSGGAALFNVNLKMLALDPEVSTIEAAAKIDGKVVGNTPVTSYNYVFSNGQTVDVPVPSTTQDNTPITMVLRNAANSELTKWYSTGGNINNPDTKGGYSNLYLISSTADSDNGMDISTPHPDARTAVDQFATSQILATNIKTVAKHGATTLQDGSADKASIGNVEATTTLAQSASQTVATQYYVYSADRPTWEIMPDGLGQGEHIDFRFYSIKVKPVKAEKPGIKIVPIYTSTLKGDQKNKGIASDGDKLDTDHTYVGIVVTATKANESATTTYNALTAEDIYAAMKEQMNTEYSGKIYKDDPLRTVLYVDMSRLGSITTANQTTMQNYATATADNCLFFMPQGFAANNMANTIAKQADGSYKAIGDVTLKDQQPFFSPYDFTTGTFSANYTREGTVKGSTTKALVRNMAAVLPFSIRLDGQGHPYLDGQDEATSYIEFRNVSNLGKLVGVKAEDETKGLTYYVSAPITTEQTASANVPYYVKIDDKHDAGFTFHVPGANFAKSGNLVTQNGVTTVTLDGLTVTHNDWTAIGNYSGVQPAAANGTWYFSKDMFWNSGQLTDYTVVNVRPFRAYYNGTKIAASKAGVVYDESDIIPTGINEVNASSTNNGRVYTLDGRYVGMSLDNLAPGLYIQNGRKVVKQ